VIHREALRRHAARISAGLVLLALVAGALVLAHRGRQDAALAEGRRLLLEGDFAAAAASFEPLQGSSRVGPAARGGLIVARTAAPDSAATSPADAKAAIDAAGVQVRPLLDGAMRNRRHGAALALGRLAADGGDATGFLYQAAALVESGRDDDARALVAAHPDVFRGPGLGREISQVLALRSAGPAIVVRDRAGRLLGKVDDAGRFEAIDGVPKEWVPPRALRDLRPGATAGARLAIDLGLSRTAAESLAARRGTIVLIDPASGAVRVALSDAATFAEGGTPAFDQQREPASIQKLITSTAALRAGLDADAEIARMTCAGSQRYGTGSLWCAYPGGKLGGLGHALAISCNLAFANLGVRIGRAAVVDELRRFGFDDDSPGAGRILAPAGDERQLADLSVGLEATEITPAHGARMAAVFAADGNMPGVFLVAAEDGAMGMSPRPLPPPPARRVLEPAWLPVMRGAMASVTGPGGTAEGVAPPSFPVAMKTGTAATPKLGYHVNYVGVGPMPDPSIAFCVRVTHLGSSPAINAAAREVLGGLLTRLGEARGRP
jgi:hypothetical protein